MTSMRSRSAGRIGSIRFAVVMNMTSREIEGHAQIMVAEGMVLFRVEHFEQSRGWIAAEIHADLVDFVHHEDRIARAGLLHALNDPPGQGADIGSAMAREFRLRPGRRPG